MMIVWTIHFARDAKQTHQKDVMATLPVILIAKGN